MEKDIYGGGGNDIHLGVVSVYATTRNEKNEYFGTDDYHVEMIMPVTGSMIHSGTHYTYTRYGSDYTAFPFLSWEAQNASLYNIYAYPTNTEKYMFNQQINQTTAPSYNVVTKNITIANAVEAGYHCAHDGGVHPVLPSTTTSTPERSSRTRLRRTTRPA